MAKKTADSVKLETGARLELDGDLVYLIDTLYREIALKQELGHSYQDVKSEIESVYSQMDAKTKREYFLNSVFLNYVTYENEMLERLAEKVRRPKANKKKR